MRHVPTKVTTAIFSDFHNFACWMGTATPNFDDPSAPRPTDAMRRNSRVVHVRMPTDEELKYAREDAERIYPDYPISEHRIVDLYVNCAWRSAVECGVNDAVEWGRRLLEEYPPNLSPKES